MGFTIIFLFLGFCFVLFLQDKGLSNGYHYNAPLEQNHILSQLENNPVYFVNRDAGYVSSNNKKYRIDPYTGSVYDERNGF